jgi:hypothetical protein
MISARPLERSTCKGLVLVGAAALLFGPLARVARAQSPVIAIGPPSFQTEAGPSLQNEVLDRLALGQPAPGDLERLSRLTLLQTIALAATLRADLYGSPLAVRLEGEVAELWNLAEAFDESVNTPPAVFAERSLAAQQLAGVQVAAAYDETANMPPADFSSLSRALELLSGVQRAYSNLEADQAVLSGASRRVGAHLQDIGRLLPAMTSEMEAVAANFGYPPTPGQTAGIDPTALRTILRSTLLDLGSVIRQVNDRERGRAGLAALIDDLNNLFDLVQGFDRLVQVQPPERELRATYLPVMRRLRQVEAEAVLLDRTLTLTPAWRQLRERIGALAETFQLPRVIAPVSAQRAPVHENRALAAQIDRALRDLDAYLESTFAIDGDPASASDLQVLVARLRLKLLEFRQYLIASSSNQLLKPRLREIEQIYREVSVRAGKDARIIRAAESPGRLQLEPLAAAIRALAEALSGR